MNKKYHLIVALLNAVQLREIDLDDFLRDDLSETKTNSTPVFCTYNNDLSELELDAVPGSATVEYALESHYSNAYEASVTKAIAALIRVRDLTDLESYACDVVTDLCNDVMDRFDCNVWDLLDPKVNPISKCTIPDLDVKVAQLALAIADGHDMCDTLQELYQKEYRSIDIINSIDRIKDCQAFGFLLP